MDLYEKMKNDLIIAMKEKDKERLTVIRMVKGAMQLEHINNKKNEDENLLIDVVSKQIKMRKDSILEFEKGNRQDLIDKANDEIKILNDYLPKQLTSEEVDEIINNVFDDVKPTSQKDMGKIMKTITPLLKGKADMKLVSEKIKTKMENI